MISQQHMTSTSNAQADVVEVERLAAQFGPLLLEILGVIDHGIARRSARPAPIGTLMRKIHRQL